MIGKIYISISKVTKNEVGHIPKYGKPAKHTDPEPRSIFIL
jgi:hypothetical protein